jgi:hypothetical protein
MTTIHAHPDAQFDRYPALHRDLAQEFGIDLLASTGVRNIDGNWRSSIGTRRVAAMNLDVFASLGDEDETHERVEILGQFHARHYTAVCISDDARSIRWMTALCPFESFEGAAIVPIGRVGCPFSIAEVTFTDAASDHRPDTRHQRESRPRSGPEDKRA